MIGWGTTSRNGEEVETTAAEDNGLKLGDLMRGERATLGKSLLDVQRELKIKASYVAAIENADPSVFDTPGFIAGYVRSYARYLNMDPEQTFEMFCRESGFQTAHGLSEKASRVKMSRAAGSVTTGDDMFTQSAIPFRPENDPLFSGIEPRALGSVAVLAALVIGLGYGGWSVLQEIQRVQFAPVDQTPVVVSDIDPLAGQGTFRPQVTAGQSTPSPDVFDRLYRPQALSVPVMAARDAPISTLAPQGDGAEPTDATELAVAQALQSAVGGPEIQVTESPAPQVALLAVRPVWVRVRASDGSVLFEKVLDAGEEYSLPASEEAPTLRAGNSGSLFFKVAGEVYGPAGSGTSTVKNVALGFDEVQSTYSVADLSADPALANFVNVAQAQTGQ